MGTQEKPRRIPHVGQAYIEALESAGRFLEADQVMVRVQTRHKPRRPNHRARPNTKPTTAPHAQVMTAMARMAKASGVAA